MKCTERLYLSKDSKKLVRAGDKRAATLYAVPGDEIPPSAAELFGLVDGALPKSHKDEPKEKDAGSNKEKKGGSNKGAKSGANEAPPAPPAQDPPADPPAQDPPADPPAKD